ncbi:MAG: LPS export ABC transporter permease LptG [Rhodospirillales bacterium]|nr:LPS export ABC transporter permease LptG [Alphaproteobacteria bacterium]MCB1840607.1 LPS export ABC transporter permease LptG [Alphaproteobacteria bacterium]MCB9977237.1 LPS export ABC transporter permease LptG [Rhodospirillales bacterium]
MRLTPTLSRYLAQYYILNLLVLTVALMALIYLFDTVELLRRAADKPDVTLGEILKMSLFKLPEVSQLMMPFSVLFSAMFTFWQLTRRYELIVVRASGFSAWQFLTPVIAIAIIFGILQMTVINPVGSIFTQKYNQLQHSLLSKQKNEIAIFQEGLWLRQAVYLQDETDSAPSDDGSPQSNKLVPGYVIFHASKIKQPEWKLMNITVLYFTEENDFLKRVHAEEAVLTFATWEMKNVLIYNRKDVVPTRQDRFELPTSLTREDIEESFASPSSMSFWKLPGYISTLEETGFDAAPLRVYYHNLLSQPLMYVAMILLAASVSMRPPRMKGGFLLIVLGVFIGFLVFFLSNFLQALGTSRQIPALLAAWSPALICFLLGLSAMLNNEDG